MFLLQMLLEIIGAINVYVLNIFLTISALKVFLNIFRDNLSYKRGFCTNILRDNLRYKERCFFTNILRDNSSD